MKIVSAILFFFCWTSLHSLTLEEKVGQLLMVHFNGVEANAEAKKLIEDAHVGGFIFFNWSNELESPKQVKTLCAGLQSLSPVPLWLAVDQEGGPVSRLKWISYPGSRALAQLPLKEAETAAEELGKELRSVGINMNLAPVVDISTDPQTSYIAKRTFGNCPEEVIPYAQAFLRGMQRTGVAAVLKHFPGYGDVVVDPHADLPILEKPLGDLSRIELKPYKVLANQAMAIMTAHILVPAFDQEKCGTISHQIITGLLREELDFRGLVVTDSLVMEGLLKNCGNLEEAAIQAILAGCDLLILGGKRLDSPGQEEISLEKNIGVFKALVKAVETGRIPLSRIEEAAARNLALKRNLRI